MSKCIQPSLADRTPCFPHRAFYHAVSKQRWTVYQKRECLFWQQQPEALQQRSTFAQAFYVPMIQPYLTELVSNQGEDMQLLELGSGPVCCLQYLDCGQKTYVDPLLDDYRRMFPGILPEQSTYLAHLAEDVDLPQHHYDMVLCLNTLSDVHNPELVLNNMVGCLKEEGLFLVSMDLWPVWLAKLHCFFSRFMPGLPGLNRLYSYTHHGFVNSLQRHFDIVDEHKVQSRLHWLSLQQEWLFVCKVSMSRRKP